MENQPVKSDLILFKKLRVFYFNETHKILSNTSLPFEPFNQKPRKLKFDDLEEIIAVGVRAFIFNETKIRLPVTEPKVTIISFVITTHKETEPGNRSDAESPLVRKSKTYYVGGKLLKERDEILRAVDKDLTVLSKFPKGTMALKLIVPEDIDNARQIVIFNPKNASYIPRQKSSLVV